MTVELDQQEFDHEHDPLMDSIVRCTGITVTEVRVLAKLEEI